MFGGAKQSSSSTFTLQQSAGSGAIGSGLVDIDDLYLDILGGKSHLVKEERLVVVIFRLTLLLDFFLELCNACLELLLHVLGSLRKQIESRLDHIVRLLDHVVDLVLDAHLVIEVTLQILAVDEVLSGLYPELLILERDQLLVLSDETGLLSVAGPFALIVDFSEDVRDDGNEQVEHDDHEDDTLQDEEDSAELDCRITEAIVEHELTGRHQVRQVERLKEAAFLERFTLGGVGNHDHELTVAEREQEEKVNEEEGTHA